MGEHKGRVKEVTVVLIHSLFHLSFSLSIFLSQSLSHSFSLFGTHDRKREKGKCVAFMGAKKRE